MFGGTKIKEIFIRIGGKYKNMGMCSFFVILSFS
jgi:hypothetical protein